MATVIKFKSHVQNALNFADRYGKASVTEYLYLAAAKSTAWLDEANPDVPVDTVEEEEDFYDVHIGMQKVSTTNIIPVVTRRDWTTGNTYVAFDKTDANAYNTAFYVLNSEGRVYECITSGGVSTVEPSGVGTAGLQGPLVDGYTWKYLYDLSLFDSSNILNDTWLPVNYEDNITAEQTSDGDLDAVNTLGAKYVIINIVLDDGGLPVDTSYRQTAIIANPLDDLAAPLTAVNALPADVTAYSGQFLHLENRVAVYRISGQSETINTVLEF